MQEYSPFKIVHHIDKLQELKDKHQTVPLQIHIVPSNVCNQRCSFCAYRMKDFPSNERFVEKDILSYEKIREILLSAADMGVKAIQFTGGGEPLVHPHILDIFKDTLSNNLDLALVSNGQALTTEICEILGEAKWVRISIDSGSPELYSLIRNVSSKIFYKVLDNIRTLIKYRKDSIIGIGFVVQRENYREIYKCAKISKDLGVNNFRISSAFTPMKYKYFSSFVDEARELSKKAEDLSDDNFTVFNLFNDRIRDNFEGVQDYDFCPIKELQTFIGADYNVYTCCTLAYNNRGLIGSIKDQTFEELWNSREKTDMFSRHSPKNICKLPCLYKGKNDFINYCISDNPKHGNFI